MLTVHHLNNSRSQRILWLLEELAVPYEVVRYERQKDLRAPPALRKIHPLGKSPVVTDGSDVVAESANILEFILDKYGAGAFRPGHAHADFARYRYWLHYAEGSAMSPLLLKLIFSALPKQPMPFIVRPVAGAIAAKVLSSFVEPQIKLHLDYLESELSARDWFAGEDFSAADVQMSFPVEAAAARTKNFGATYPRLNAFLERIRARPAYQRAESRGGPYTIPS